MNYVSLGIGVVAIGYGVATIFLRTHKPSSFAKLEPMKRMWGEKSGMALHVISYSVLPIVLGIIAIILGLQGKSFL